MNIFDIFYFSCNAILPIVLLILLGYILRRLNVFDDNFLTKANSIVFKIFIPILLFYNIAFIDENAFSSLNGNLMLYAALAISALFIIGLVIVKLFIKDDKQKGVILQCLFRSNYAIIGIPLCEFLTENLSELEKGIALGNATLMAALSVPLFNIFAVIALSIFNKDGENKTDVKKILLRIIKNPLIIGVFIGLVTLCIRMCFINLGVDLSKSNISSNFFYKAIKNAAGIASPFALIVLGGRFKFSAVKKLLSQITFGTFLRVAIVPLITLFIGYFLGFRHLEFPTLIALFATPVAVSSAPMAAEMNQDSELAGQLVVWTSILSILSLFIIVMVCYSCSII